MNERDAFDRERELLDEVLRGGTWAGGGPMTRRCEASIERELGAAHALLTPSATAALEMCALLADLQPGDEAILPSFTFSSTANAIALRGAIPVFVDVRPDTLNLDERLVESAIGPRTKAIVAVHYAGVCAEMDALAAVATRCGALVVEDAAQAYLSSYKGRCAGTLGDMAAFSFHQTKSPSCGEGGAFTTGTRALFERAEIVREKGTNRGAFVRGAVDKYTWVDIGSSYLPSEFSAAVLCAQLERAKQATALRLALWNRYHEGFAGLEARGSIERPTIPPHCTHNAHAYRIMLPDGRRRDALLSALRSEGIAASFHFLPLHESPAGSKYGRAAGDLSVTRAASARLLRLPLYDRMAPQEVDAVVERVLALAR